MGKFEENNDIVGHYLHSLLILLITSEADFLDQFRDEPLYTKVRLPKFSNNRIH